MGAAGQATAVGAPGAETPVVGAPADETPTVAEPAAGPTVTAGGEIPTQPESNGSSRTADPTTKE
ncbi:hypothetical protein DZF91_06895 [Actinomadura logoneensis]|uniref:Uncharacterized protein n=1 Tax=Actinomadura logoneensis TaxID=2293572 RepID=A0A372JQT3_9ACTN|nr:hypothetical protein DZF91_06895 [Actinomadura logoneensis]